MDDQGEIAERRGMSHRTTCPKCGAAIIRYDDLTGLPPAEYDGARRAPHHWRACELHVLLRERGAVASVALVEEMDARLAEATEQAYAEDGYVGGPGYVVAHLAVAKFLAEIGIDERVIRAVADGNYGPASVDALRATMTTIRRMPA